MIDKANAVINYLSSNIDSNLNMITTTDESNNQSVWKYWTDQYYPIVIRESYPVYFQQRAMDKGKQAFEIIKILKDKKLVKLEKVGDFIDLMDELIKIL